MNRPANTPPLAEIARLFRNAGYAEETCDVLQQAEMFLDRAQRDVRSHFFMVSDREGRDFFMRPDFTLPLLLHQEDHKDMTDPEMRVFYRGPVFRNRQGRCEARQQIGVEFFRADDWAQADAEVIRLMRDALAIAGLKTPSLRIGDPGLFDAFVQALPFDERWRHRLRRLFRRRPVAQDGRVAQGGGLDLVLKRSDEMGAARPARDLSGIPALEAFLRQQSLTHTGARTPEEILARWREKTGLPAISASASALLEKFLNIEGPAPDALDRVRRLAEEVQADGGDADKLNEEIAAMGARLNQLTEEKFNPGAITFSARFLGAGLAYYTGFVFAFDPPDRPGFGLAGGGRYRHEFTPISGVGAALYLSDLEDYMSGKNART